MKKNIATIVKENLTNAVDSLGYELYDVEYAKKQNGMNLTLYIVSKDGSTINLQDCEKVHRFVDGMLDDLNPTDDAPYYLNVSSVGLDRPLKDERDYKRCLNKDVEVKLFTQIDDKKQFIGTLVDFDKDCIVVKLQSGQQISIPQKNIAVCKLYIDF